MKLERNRAGNRYTFTPEDEKDEKFLDRIGKLEEENKKLKEDVERLIKLSEHKTTTIMGLGKNLDEAKEENRKLKEEIKRLEFDVDAWYQLKLLLEGEIEKQKEEMQAMERTLDHLGYGERTY